MEKPVDLKKIFLQIGDEVKKAELKAEPPLLPAIRKYIFLLILPVRFRILTTLLFCFCLFGSLFAKKFKFKLTNDFPPIYVRDADSTTFYELEKPYAIEDKSTLKLHITEDYDDPRNEGLNKKGTTNFKKLMREMETLKVAIMGKSHKSSESEKTLVELEAKHVRRPPFLSLRDNSECESHHPSIATHQPKETSFRQGACGIADPIGGRAEKRAPRCKGPVRAGHVRFIQTAAGAEEGRRRHLKCL